MKITDIRAVRLEVPPSETPPQGSLRAGWAKDAEVANPMSRYARFKRHRNLWTPKWGDVWCKVTLEDGTWGLGHTGNGVAGAVIDQHLGPLLVGEDGLAGEEDGPAVLTRTERLSVEIDIHPACERESHHQHR